VSAREAERFFEINLKTAKRGRVIELAPAVVAEPVAKDAGILVGRTV
jgi:hypothetical protein